MPSKATNPTDPTTTMIRTREGDGRVYLTPDPPRLLATGRRRRVGRERERKRSRQDRRRKNTNQTKREGIEERDPKTYLASRPRRRKNKTKVFFFYFCVRVRICSPDRWESKGREAPTSRRVKGQGSTGPTRRWQRETARRAVAFVAAKCPAGDVICDSLTCGPPIY